MPRLFFFPANAAALLLEFCFFWIFFFFLDTDDGKEAARLATGANVANKAPLSDSFLIILLLIFTIRLNATQTK